MRFGTGSETGLDAGSGNVLELSLSGYYLCTTVFLMSLFNFNCRKFSKSFFEYLLIFVEKLKVCSRRKSTIKFLTMFKFYHGRKCKRFIKTF